MAKITVELLENHGDARGESFSLSIQALQFLPTVKDIHVASIRPDAVRGNHFHLRRREIVIVTHLSTWAFCWDEGEHTHPRKRVFPGAGAVAILIEPGCSHAVENIGDSELSLVSLSSLQYDPTETVPRNVVKGTVESV